jgi:hypothetical protein
MSYLREYPKKLITHEPNTVITSGDMHGNVMKYIWLLVKNEVLKLEKPEDFYSLWELYDKDWSYFSGGYDSPHMGSMPKQEQQEALASFREIIGRAEVNPSCRIRLLGDFIADRGKNDWMTLLVLEKLEEVGVRTEIVASNHDMFFLNEYYRGDPKLWGKSNSDYGDYVFGIKRLVDDGVVSQEELIKMIERVYYPNFKLISYALSEDKKKITLFTHAPNCLDPIKDLARELDVVYKDKDAQELAETIDGINLAFQILRFADDEKFKKMVEVAATTALRCEYDSCYRTKHVPYSFDQDSPLSALVWNYGNKTELEKLPDYVEQLVHGHIGAKRPESDRCLNLDNDLGRPNHDDGFYNSHRSPERVWDERYEFSSDVLLDRIEQLREAIKKEISSLDGQKKQIEGILRETSSSFLNTQQMARIVGLVNCNDVKNNFIENLNQQITMLSSLNTQASESKSYGEIRDDIVGEINSLRKLREEVSGKLTLAKGEVKETEKVVQEMNGLRLKLDDYFKITNIVHRIVDWFTKHAVYKQAKKIHKHKGGLAHEHLASLLQGVYPEKKGMRKLQKGVIELTSKQPQR